jgi:hypothetical protein
MKKEMVSQKYLTLQPFFILFHEFEGVHKLFLKNIGNGAALYLTVKFENGVRKSDQKEIFINGLRFDLIELNEIKPIEFDNCKLISGLRYKHNLLFLSPELEGLEDETIAQTDLDINVIIKYQNILGDEKSQKFSIKNGKIKMEKDSFFNF